MSLTTIDTRIARRLSSFALLGALAFVACGDDSAAGGSGGGAGDPGGSDQGGQGGMVSGPGGNGSGGAPQAGEAPGGSSQGGSAEGGNAQGGNAEGGHGGGSGTPTIAEMCQTACGYLADCFGRSPAECTVECSTDLGDCSPTELGEVDSCNQAITNDCELVNELTDCLEAVACISGV